jgi:hypothetical protein
MFHALGDETLKQRPQILIQQRFQVFHRLKGRETPPGSVSPAVSGDETHETAPTRSEGTLETAVRRGSGLLGGER